MKSSKLYHSFPYCLLVIVFLMTANLSIPSTNYLVELAELEEELGEWSKEIDAETDYEFGDGNDDDNNNDLLHTAYWTPSKLFSFIGKNDSKTILTRIATIPCFPPLPLYLLFQQLKLDC